jgi:hypothetical protein
MVRKFSRGERQSPGEEIVESMVVKMLKLAAVMLKEQQVAPGSQQEKELVEVLDRIHYDGGLEVRMAVIAIWGDHSELFRSRICASMVHHTQTIRLAAIRACTPLEQFARELEITFTVGTLSDRRAVVEMWSKDPTTFSANLRVAANDPMLVEEVVAIWAQSPGYFSASLRSVYLEGSLKARLAVESFRSGAKTPCLSSRSWKQPSRTPFYSLRW